VYQFKQLPVTHQLNDITIKYQNSKGLPFCRSPKYIHNKMEYPTLSCLQEQLRRVRTGHHQITITKNDPVYFKISSHEFYFLLTNTYDGMFEAFYPAFSCSSLTTASGNNIRI
jgi:hypothetical protein